MEENRCKDYSVMWCVLGITVLVAILCGYTLVYEWYVNLPHEAGEVIENQLIK